MPNSLRWSEEQYHAHLAQKGKPIEASTPKPKTVIRQSGKGPNKTESRFENEHLKVWLNTGEIKKYRFESIRLKLGNGHWYKCDWTAVNKAGVLSFYEVKGGRPRQREAGIADIKTAAFQYPDFEFWLCRYQGGEWIIQKVLA